MDTNNANSKCEMYELDFGNCSREAQSTKLSNYCDAQSHKLLPVGNIVCIYSFSFSWYYVQRYHHEQVQYLQTLYDVSTNFNKNDNGGVIQYHFTSIGTDAKNACEIFSSIVPTSSGQKLWDGIHLKLFYDQFNNLFNEVCNSSLAKEFQTGGNVVFVVDENANSKPFHEWDFNTLSESITRYIKRIIK